MDVECEVVHHDDACKPADDKQPEVAVGIVVHGYTSVKMSNDDDSQQCGDEPVPAGKPVQYSAVAADKTECIKCDSCKSRTETER